MCHPTDDGQEDRRLIEDTRRAGHLERLAVCRQQGYDKVWCPPHLGACQVCRDVLENKVFTIDDIERNTNHQRSRGEPLRPCLPLHPNCRHCWIGYDPEVFEVAQEEQRKMREAGLTDEKVNEMFDSGGELKPEYADAVDWSMFS